MRIKNCDIRIGTSGWNYKHWKGRFYPEKLAQRKWLEFYAQTFNAVEINNTFYRLPKQSAVANWYKQSPDDFQFTVKASRYITHLKRLKDPADHIERFYESVSSLKEKMTSVLFQLPPNFKKNISRLEQFLEALPDSPKSIFEFRNTSWYCDETYDLLKAHNCAFCIHDYGDVASPVKATADFAYLRFHGSKGKYYGKYHGNTLNKWARHIEQLTENCVNLFVYFNNDLEGFAVENAKTLKEKLGK